MENYAAIKADLFSTNENSVLLGNGFNMSIGIQTGSKNLLSKLKKTEAFQVIHQMLADLENNEEYDLEEFTTKMGNREEILKKEIFKLILQNSAPIEEHIIQKIKNFLAGFKWKFTTNYDPVVYRLALWNQKLYEQKIKDKGPFGMDDIKEIFETIPDALKKNMPAGGWSSHEVSKLLHLKSDDGFRPCAERLKWTRPGQQKSFYLHGAFHLYTEKGEVYKRTRRELESLHSTLMEVNYSHLSIFRLKDKPRKIRRNKYLKHCYESLKNIPGHLCIIGWNCAEKDAHLAKVIKKIGKRPIFASLYWQKDLYWKGLDAYGEPERTILNYLNQFPEEEIRFFDIDTVDYKIEE